MNKDSLFSYSDVFQNSPGCDQTDQLYRYFLRTLPDEQRTTFENHLSSCEPCMQLLMQLSESENLAEKTVMDASKSDRAFEQVRVKIQERLKTKYCGVSEARPNRTYRGLIFLNATLLVAIAILIYPAYRSTVLDQQLQQLQSELHSKQLPDQTTTPQPEPTAASQPEKAPTLSQAKIYRLHLRRENTEQNKIDIVFDQSNESYTLIFAVPPDYDSYALDIVQRDRVVWHSNLRATANHPSRLISVQLNAAYFEAGEYSIQILGQSADGETKFQPYTLLVEKHSK